MQATIIGFSNGVAIIRVRRSLREEHLYIPFGKSAIGLKTGDKIIVKRQTNNPYPVFVSQDQDNLSHLEGT